MQERGGRKRLIAKEPDLLLPDDYDRNSMSPKPDAMPWNRNVSKKAIQPSVMDFWVSNPVRSPIIMDLACTAVGDQSTRVGDAFRSNGTKKWAMRARHIGQPT